MLPDSTWVLTVDDMVAELEVMSFIQQAVVIRTTRLTDYAFDELPHQLFRGKKKEVRFDIISVVANGEKFTVSHMPRAFEPQW